jgi:hypothetical protein
MGRNLLQIFGPSFVKCYTFRIAKQQLIILSRTVQSKGCTTVSRMHFAHAPPWRLGPRSYLLYSSASVHSRGKTLVFSRLRQFLALQLSCPTNFCKETHFLLIQLLKNLKTNFGCSCFFFAQAQFQVPAAGRAARQAAARPHSSGMPRRRYPCLSTTPMTTPTPSCSVDPTPSPSGLGPEMRLSRSAASRPARKWTPRLAVRDAAADHASAHPVLLPPSGSRFETRWFLHLLLSGATKRWSRNHFSGRGLVFARTGLVAPPLSPQQRYPHRQWSPPQRLNLWPLLLPADARAWGEPCGDRFTPLVDSQTS